MKLYAVIDTNVLVSALLRWDSVPGAVLEQALIGSIVPLLSDELTQETTILTGYLDELRMAANRRPFVHVLIIWRLSPVTPHYPHSSQGHVPTDHPHHSPPTLCWASRNRLPSPPGRDNTSQISRDTAVTPS